MAHDIDTLPPPLSDDAAEGPTDPTFVDEREDTAPAPELVEVAATPTPPPPRPGLLQRLAAGRGATGVAFILALAAHVALIALAVFSHHAPAQSFEEPHLLLPRGWATEYENTRLTHPTVSFLNTTPEFNSGPQVDPSPADVFPTEPSPLTAADTAVSPPTVQLDASHGTSDLSLQMALGSDMGTPPNVHRRSGPTTTSSGAPSSNASPGQAAPEIAAGVAAPVDSESASGPGPQGVPDGPPVPSTRNKIPPYPAQSLRRGIAGTVLLELHIDTEGRVAEAMVRKSSGHEALDRAARDTALTWSFSPARLNGRLVAVYVLRPVNFIPPR